MSISIKKGDEVFLDINGIAFGGRGTGRIDDYVVFVEQALPGQKVKAKIIKKKKHYSEAKTVQVVKHSSLETSPNCQHFGHCGGCLFQNLLYAEQLRFKQEQALSSIERIGRISNFSVEDIVPAPRIYNYRNKMEFSFSDTRWLTPDELKSSKIYPNQNIFLGLHAKGFYDKIVDIQECHLMDNIYPIIAAVRQMAKKSKLPAYNNRTHTGFFRFLVIRKSEHFDELMVNLVVRDYDASLFELYKTEMLKYPQITSLVANTTASKANVAFGEKEYLISGDATIKDKIGSLIFEISSGSFFQTNTQQAEHLYNIVLEYASLTGKEIVYDFYSGAGTISLFISHLAKQVIGFESVADAVDDANRNKQRNNIENCTFVQGDLLQLIKDVKSITLKYGIPDVIITDPPRAGMHPKTLQSILLLNPKRIVHVSCNPATLARDVAILCEKEYKLSKIKPVDMFPHTAHIEVVALLEKKHA